VEVVRGLQKIGSAGRIADVIRSIRAETVLPFDADVAVTAGKIYGDLERTGQTIGRADPMIAATAIHHGLALVTGNHRHFERVVQLGYSLQLENWRT
jgi:predicted nucleic acid-binding protein